MKALSQVLIRRFLATRLGMSLVLALARLLD